MKSQHEFHIITSDSETREAWNENLRNLSSRYGEALSALNSIIWIDSETPDWQKEVRALKREGLSFVLVVSEHLKEAEINSIQGVDDLATFPFRAAELLSISKHHHERLAQKVTLEEVKGALQDMRAAEELLERIQQARTPKRFKDIKGLQVMSKHLSGLKPGGDYFDVFESAKKDFVNILLVDSSSYGVSAALLGMILSSSARIGSDTSTSPGEWVKAIYQELKITLGDQGHFSVFFGRINRRDFSLHYQLYGSIEAFVVERSGECHQVQKHGNRISQNSAPDNGFEKVIHLNPKDRIVLLSDGFVNGVGGEFHLQKIFHERMDKDPFTVVNELSYQIKSKLQPGDTFPGEDCSAIVIDIENRVLRLAPAG